MAKKNMMSESKSMDSFIKSSQMALSKYGSKMPMLKSEYKEFGGEMPINGENAKAFGRKLTAGMGMNKACFPVK